MKIYNRFSTGSARKLDGRNDTDTPTTINIRATDIYGKPLTVEVKLEVDGNTRNTFVEGNVLKLAQELGDVLDIWVAAMEQVGVKGLSFYASGNFERQEANPTFINSREGLSAFADFIEK